MPNLLSAVFYMVSCPWLVEMSKTVSFPPCLFLGPKIASYGEKWSK
uniref:Uncharacterized protein n=1 Tax=Rhizophora mucronata TaxID=61149 RepID=A0A2P2P9T4_RHIMU